MAPRRPLSSARACVRAHACAPRREPASHDSRSAAMRSAAWPSQSSGTRPRLPPSGRISSTHAQHARAVAADQRVRALLDRDRALGVLAHRQARHAERGRLFLDAARIGQHEPCARHQAEHLEIALRLEQRDRARRAAIGRTGRSARCWRACADARATPAATRCATSAQHGERLARATSRLSTFEGRCSVTTPKPAAPLDHARVDAGARQRRRRRHAARGRCASSESIITLLNLSM